MRIIFREDCFICKWIFRMIQLCVFFLSIKRSRVYFLNFFRRIRTKSFVELLDNGRSGIINIINILIYRVTWSVRVGLYVSWSHQMSWQDINSSRVFIYILSNYHVPTTCWKYSIIYTTFYYDIFHTYYIYRRDIFLFLFYFF